MMITLSQTILREKADFFVLDELREQIDVDLIQLRRSVAALAPVLEKVRNTPPDTVEIMALAAMLHSFYTGLEGIFKRVHLALYGNVPTGEFSHAKLLDAMIVPGPSWPAVISGELRDVLRGYLQFRHVFRHAYSHELKWKYMASLVAEVEQPWTGLRTRSNVFLRASPGEAG